MGTAVHLALNELWRNRLRFLLFSLVVTLITVLILFIAALGEGLGSGNREYLQKLNAASKKRARELLVLLGLEDRLNLLPSQLSGGQRQRVAIARALINRPTLVLADEPTASLDTERALQVVETMANLVHEQGNAGIMVTHDLRMVEYADRVVQMMDGRVAREVSPKDDLSCLANPAECRMIPPEVLGVGQS